MKKPSTVFDRDGEWKALTTFSTDSSDAATLGVISGRRRQGKTYLLNALAKELGGFYFGATEATETDSLRFFGASLGEFLGVHAPLQFADWSAAVDYLFSLGTKRPLVAAIDEFPYLTKASPGLPSLLQRELDAPAQSRHRSRIRLLLCGSAMSVMGKLLVGNAPLRGRAGLELIVRSLGFRHAAQFWGVSDPTLAILVNAIVGGTPAYRQFVRGDVPHGIEDFDDWVIRTVLNPTTPLFREGRYLLTEEADVRDPALYHSVLGAVAAGNSTWGGIANHVGRKGPDIAHPLTVLEDCGLLVREPDAFRNGRSSYRIAEPLITFYHAVMRETWSRLELGLGATVWRDMKQRFFSHVVGPRFEQLCREFALTASADTFGDTPAEVATGIVTDPVARQQIEIDVAVFGPTEPGQPRRVLSLGEVKWGKTMQARHLARLQRAKDLLAAKGYDTRDTKLACYSAAGFSEELTNLASDAVLIDPVRLYQSMS